MVIFIVVVVGSSSGKVRVICLQNKSTMSKVCRHGPSNTLRINVKLIAEIRLGAGGENGMC